jgi:hypothetical protein
LLGACPTILGVSKLANLTKAAVMVLKSRGILPDCRGCAMNAYWVIDILKDIRQFSEKNGMVELAEQLDDAIFVAASEIGVKLAGPGSVDAGAGRVRGISRATADNEVN